VEYFKSDDKRQAFFAILDVGSNAKILQNVVLQCKKLKKAAYVFSVDQPGKKVVHANYVPESARTKGLDARTWASKVADVLGGKAGGREDSAQGVGTEVDKVDKAFAVAEEHYSTY